MTDLMIEPWGVDAEDFPRRGTPRERAAFLLRYAILAPSSHNTQPWEFRVEDERIDVYADHSRWLKVADSDQRELYLSVGCALENLLIAAERFGYAPGVEYLPHGNDDRFVARVRLDQADDDRPRSRPPELFDAILQRRTNRSEYDGREIPGAVVADLQVLAGEEGIRLHFTDDPDVRRRVDELTLRADAVQFADPEWREELGYWLGRGVFGTGWLMSKVARFAVSHLDLGGSTGKKDHELLESASLLGLVCVREVSRETTVRAGQVFERVFLAATAADLALQPMNQILQVPEVRDEFEDLLPEEWGAPRITFRMGFAEAEEPTPRRPLEAVLR